MELDAREFAVLCQCPLFAGVVPAALPALLRALHADMPLIMEKLGIEVDGRELGRVIRNAIA